MRISSITEDFYVGDEAQEKRGVLHLDWPIQRGIIKDFDGMEKIWNHLIDKELQAVVDSSDDCEDYKGVFLTESPLLPMAVRQKTMETWFETFKARHYFVAIGAVLGLYSTGQETGIAVDSGDGVTHAVPTWEGYHITNAIRRMNMAGRDLTEYMERLLCEADVNLTSSAERMTAMLMKGSFENEANNPDYQGCYVSMNIAEDMEKGVEPQDFNMPDGSKVTISDQLIRVPELMFNPSLDGKEMSSLQEICNQSQLACPLDCRQSLLNYIVLIGGNTMFPMMKERLEQEINNLGVLSEVKVVAQPDREISAFQGGQMLATLGGFTKFMISKEEYEEAGEARATLMQNKCSL